MSERINKKIEGLLTSSPEVVAESAAALGYSKERQREIAQHTAEGQSARIARDRNECIEALKNVPGTDPVLAMADDKPGEIPDEGWLVASRIAPGYGGRIDIYRYGQGQLQFGGISDTREKYGQVRVHFSVEGGDRYALAYENPDFPNKDTEPYNRMSPTSYLPLRFSGTDIIPLNNGGRLIDQKDAMGTHPGIHLSTSMDWDDFDREATRDFSSDLPVNRIVPDKEELGPILAGLSYGMGLDAQDLEVLVGAMDSKISPTTGS